MNCSIRSACAHWKCYYKRAKCIPYKKNIKYKSTLCKHFISTNCDRQLLLFIAEIRDSLLHGIIFRFFPLLFSSLFSRVFAVRLLLVGSMCKRAETSVGSRYYLFLIRVYVVFPRRITKNNLTKFHHYKRIFVMFSWISVFFFSILFPFGLWSHLFQYCLYRLSLCWQSIDNHLRLCLPCMHSLHIEDGERKKVHERQRNDFMFALKSNHRTE